MANNNETVEQVCGEFKTSSHTCNNCDFEVCPSIIVFADRIIAAHNREIMELQSKEADASVLRSLVKELADTLECAICGLSNKVVTYGETYRLVAKAREVVQ